MSDMCRIILSSVELTVEPLLMSYHDPTIADGTGSALPFALHPEMMGDNSPA